MYLIGRLKFPCSINQCSTHDGQLEAALCKIKFNTACAAYSLDVEYLNGARYLNVNWSKLLKQKQNKIICKYFNSIRASLTCKINIYKSFTPFSHQHTPTSKYIS